MQIKHLVFDMGNVLIQYDPGRYLAAYVPDEAARPLLMREVFRSVEWVQMDHGTLTEEEAIAASCARLPQRLHEAAAQLYRHWNEDIPPVPGVEQLIARARAAGYGIYLLSNTSERYHRFRRHIAALRWFDGEFISADWHLLKPDVAIYQAFCQHFGLVPAQCLFVDDLPGNVYGARCAGMDGVVFHGDAAELEAQLARHGVELKGGAAQ